MYMYMYIENTVLKIHMACVVLLSTRHVHVCVIVCYNAIELALHVRVQCMYIHVGKGGVKLRVCQSIE